MFLWDFTDLRMITTFMEKHRHCEERSNLCGGHSTDLYADETLQPLNARHNHVAS
jgi:hypothetical protein